MAENKGSNGLHRYDIIMSLKSSPSLAWHTEGQREKGDGRRLRKTGAATWIITAHRLSTSTK